MTRPDWEDRFWAKVNKNGPIPKHCPELGPCWLWTAFAAGGYGRFRVGDRAQLAHRVSFFLANGRWPEPCGCHRCDNTLCVNDSHVFEGTNADNNADRDAKGRQVARRGDRNGAYTQPHRMPRGEHHGCAKLTEQDVRDIRANYALCRVSLKELGSRFGVSATTIHAVIRRYTWTRAKADREAKGGRGKARGEQNGNAKLSADDVRSIRAEYALGRATQSQLGERFGVNRSLVSAIVRGKIWKRLDEQRCS